MKFDCHAESHRHTRMTPHLETKLNKSTVGVLIALACGALVGCSNVPVEPPATTKPMGAAAPLAASGSTEPVTSPTASTAPLPAYLDPKNPISTQRSVYFDFDDFSVKNEYQGLIERHGRYLTSMPKLAIKIEGNADERGSAEYNLALGQKRAEAVRKALEIHGVQASQLEPVSWGSERPKAQGHDETAWAQNRRADLTYPKQ
jgi:peptidoglycan-associated lipoprotein